MALEGKVAIVTGATGIVGEGIARAFLESGATLVCPVRRCLRQRHLLPAWSSRMPGIPSFPAHGIARAFLESGATLVCPVRRCLRQRHLLPAWSSRMPGIPSFPARFWNRFSCSHAERSAGKESGLRAALGSPPSARLDCPVGDYASGEGAKQLARYVQLKHGAVVSLQAGRTLPAALPRVSAAAPKTATPLPAPAGGWQLAASLPSSPFLPSKHAFSRAVCPHPGCSCLHPAS
jgi:uncharacterized membrane protein (UPF0136 family)